MRKLSIGLLLFCFACGVGKTDVQVKKWLDVQSEKERIFLQLITKTDKLAPGATFENRDSAAFLPYYQERMKLHDFANYYMNDSVRYFQLYRIVPSLFKERIAIAGRYKTGKNGQIIEFEEVYITPKMKDDELSEKATLLFTQLIAENSVQPYLGNREYIDFPDSLNTYNKETQRWDFKYAQWFAK